MKKLMTAVIICLACTAFGAQQTIVLWKFTYSIDGTEMTAVVEYDWSNRSGYAIQRETEDGLQLITCTDLTDQSTWVIHEIVPGAKHVKTELDR